MAEQQTAVQRMEACRSMAMGVVNQMAMTLASYGKDPHKYSLMVAEGLMRTPDIMRCTDTSLARAFRQACSMGMIPDGRQAVIVPFKNKNGGLDATFMPMKLGMQLAVHEMTHGLVRSGLIREQDNYDYSEGSEGTVFKHTPNLKPVRGDGSSNNVIAAWASLELLKNKIIVRVVDFDDLEEARTKGLSKNSNGPWKTSVKGMYEKTAVKALLSRNEYLIYNAIGGDDGKIKRFEAMVDSETDDDAIDVTDEEKAAQVKEEQEPQRPGRRGTTQAPKKNAQAKEVQQPAPGMTVLSETLGPQLQESFLDDPSVGIGDEIGGAAAEAEPPPLEEPDPQAPEAQGDLRDESQNEL